LINFTKSRIGIYLFVATIICGLLLVFIFLESVYSDNAIDIYDTMIGFFVGLNLLSITLAAEYFKQYQEHKKLNGQISLLFDELRHRRNSDLHNVNILCEREMSRESIKNDSLMRIQRWAISTSKIYRLIDRRSNQSDLVEFVGLFRVYCIHLADINSIEIENLDLELNVSDKLLMSSSKARTLGILLAELFSNSHRHCIPKDGYLKISLTCNVIGNLLQIDYADNGINPRKEWSGAWQLEGRGLELIRKMVLQRLNGDFSILSIAPFYSRIEFELNDGIR